MLNKLSEDSVNQVLRFLKNETIDICIGYVSSFIYISKNKKILYTIFIRNNKFVLFKGSKVPIEYIISLSSFKKITLDNFIEMREKIYG